MSGGAGHGGNDDYKDVPVGQPPQDEDFLELDAEDLTTIDPSTELSQYGQGAGYDDIVDLEDMGLDSVLTGPPGLPPRVPSEASPGSSAPDGFPEQSEPYTEAGAPAVSADGAEAGYADQGYGDYALPEGFEDSAEDLVALEGYEGAEYEAAEVLPAVGYGEQPQSVGSYGEYADAGEYAGGEYADAGEYAAGEYADAGEYAEAGYAEPAEPAEGGEYADVGEYAEAGAYVEPGEYAEAADYAEEEAYEAVPEPQAEVGAIYEEEASAAELPQAYEDAGFDEQPADLEEEAGEGTPPDAVQAAEPEPELQPELEPEPEPAPVPVVVPVPVKAAKPEPARREPPAELAGAEYLSDHEFFRQETRRLARSRKWQELAEMTSNAADYGTWAAVKEVQAALLLDLSRLYADQLSDAASAEESFRRLVKVDPTNREAMSFLDAAYRERGDHRRLHDLYKAAAEGSWDPAERLSLMREAVGIASGPLNDASLAISDWEHLWSLGESGEEVRDALLAAYRRHGGWEPLARFLMTLADAQGEVRQRSTLREVAEIYISSLRRPEQAAPILDRIRSSFSSDPVALLNMARVAFQTRDFDQLAALGRIDGLAEDVARDIQRVAADALWQAGERDLAVDVYETLLQRDPEDRDALRAKERHYTESKNYSALCSFLESRADRTLPEGGQPPIEERVSLLERAARIAEEDLRELDRAIGLWQRRVDVGGPTREAYRKLTDLYEAEGNLNGVAASLEGLLVQTPQPRARIEIVARLGEIYAHDLGDDIKGEEMWRALLNLVPGDTRAQAELADIYGRRGDFDALDQALNRQVATASDGNVLELVVSAARNVEENIGDAGRSASAWEQVLDYAANDFGALTSLSGRLGELGRTRERVAALEMRVQAAEPEQRIDLCLELAGLWASLGDAQAAVATYERILRWSPGELRALEALESLVGSSQPGAVRSALELAVTLAEEGERAPLLQRVLSHVAEDDVERRFALLRRLVAVGDERSITRLRDTAEAQGRFADLAAVYTRLAGQALTIEDRTDALRELARIFEGPLDDAARAFVTLSSTGFDPERHDKVLKELERVGRVTGRWEELLAVHDGLASAHFDAERRRAALAARVRILVEELKQPARALDDLWRMLVLDPSDAGALGQAESLANEHGLAHQLYALYGELWDLADDDPTRASIAAKRQALVAGKLADKQGGLEELILQYRVSPDESLATALRTAAEGLDQWAVVIPRLEAAERAASKLDIARLLDIAQLYESKLGNKVRAFELYSEALLADPSRAAVLGELERLAEADTAWDRLAQALRSAAARASTGDALHLYQRVADLYGEKLGSPGRAIDIHRRMLRLSPAACASLDAMIAWHREHQEWADLRDRLIQRIGSAADGDDVAGMWMEVAAISSERLEDPEGALEAYAKILSLDAAHEGARNGVAALTGDAMTPEVAARRLRLELNLASEQERPDVLLRLAQLQDKELNLPDAARETLETLVKETGATGPGYAPLSALLERLESWSELIDLLESHADASDDEESCAQALRRALELSDAHRSSHEESERLALKLRKLEPDNEELHERLARAMRASGRWEDLAELLKVTLDATRDAGERLTVQRELACVLDLALDRSDEALTLLKASAKEHKGDRAALLHQATLHRRVQNLDAYLSARETHADLIDPEWGALVHCHLAETADESGQEEKVADYYRSARKLDAKNPVAGEALRALGRRLKNWRKTSALLTDDDERELSWAERSKRLLQRGQGAAASNPEEAIDWLHRALAVDPDNIEAWQALSVVHAVQGDAAGRLEAELGALGAFERTTKPSPEMLVRHAKLLHAAADAARAADEQTRARRLDGRAYRMAPSFAPAAFAVADSMEADGDISAAFDLYNSALATAVGLSSEDEQRAVFRRGDLAAKLGNVTQAIDDLRATVRNNPLHASALDALANIFAEQGHPALALANLQQALVVAADKERRGQLYYRLGQLWEDGLSNAVEGGAYYELALEHGAADPTLMKRALDHYRRDGRFEAALTMVEELIESTEDAHALATLWVTKGEILEAMRPNEAIEAFDMALSYEPGAASALDGLERMLAAREEWEQLADLLEGRIDTSEPSERAAALSRLADLCQDRLGDLGRANDVLFRLLDLAPESSACDRLLANLAQAPIEERRELLVHAVGRGKQRFDRAIELARYHLEQGRGMQAWAVLAPLRVVIHLEADLKEIVNDLRKDFERAESTELLGKVKEARAPFRPLHGALLDAVTRIRNASGPLGLTELESVTTGAVQVSESTPNGKLFADFAEAMGVTGAQLYRSVELPEAIVVMDTDPVVVCIRTEVFQKASGNELYFWLAEAIELARPEVKALTSIPLEDRKLMGPALLAALQLAPVPAGGAALVAKLNGLMDDAMREALRDLLEAALAEEKPGDAAGLWLQLIRDAERMASLVVADLRAVWRALSRMYEDIPEQRSIKSLESLNEMFDANDVLSSVLQFYVSSEFSGFAQP